MKPDHLPSQLPTTSIAKIRTSVIPLGQSLSEHDARKVKNQVRSNHDNRPYQLDTQLRECKQQLNTYIENYTSNQPQFSLDEFDQGTINSLLTFLKENNDPETTDYCNKAHNTFNQNSDEPLIQIPIELDLKTQHFSLESDGGVDSDTPEPDQPTPYQSMTLGEFTVDGTTYQRPSEQKVMEAFTTCVAWRAKNRSGYIELQCRLTEEIVIKSDFKNYVTGLFDSHLDTPIDQMQQLNDPNSVAEIDMLLNESDQMSESDSIIDQIQLVRLSIQELNFNILENQQIFLESRSDELLPKKLNTFTTAWKNQEDTYDTDIATEQNHYQRF